MKELDNRGSHYYLAMYWAKALSEQSSDEDLKQKFSKVYEDLSSNEDKILQELNGFNEYILRGHNDHDLISRILKRNPNLKRTTVYDKIHKLEHKNELRVEASRPAFLLNNEDFYWQEVSESCHFLSKQQS